MSQFRNKIFKIKNQQRSEQIQALDRSNILRRAMGLTLNDLKMAYDTGVTWRTLRHTLAVEHRSMCGGWHYFVTARDFLGSIPDDDKMPALLEEIADYYEFDDEQN